MRSSTAAPATRAAPHTHSAFATWPRWRVAGGRRREARAAGRRDRDLSGRRRPREHDGPAPGAVAPPHRRGQRSGIRLRRSRSRRSRVRATAKRRLKIARRSAWGVGPVVGHRDAQQHLPLALGVADRAPAGGDLLAPHGAGQLGPLVEEPDDPPVQGVDPAPESTDLRRLGRRAAAGRAHDAVPNRAAIASRASR